MRPSPDRSSIPYESLARRATPKSRSGPCDPASDWLRLYTLRPIKTEAVKHAGVIGVKQYFDGLSLTMRLLFVVVDSMVLKKKRNFNDLVQRFSFSFFFTV